MERDIRASRNYRDALSVYEAIRRPGSGRVSDASEIHVSPTGTHAVFTGTILEKLDGIPPTRICQVDLASGDLRVLTSGPCSDRLPKYSPDGELIAFLSDRHKPGDFQLYLLDGQRSARAASRVGGWIEYLHWSPDGKRILLGVAGHGADLSGGQGAVASNLARDGIPSWMPVVETGGEGFRWRHAWLYEIDTGSVRRVGPRECNVWEAVWCGDGAIAAVVSPGPGEGLWYSARLHLFDIRSDRSREIHAPTNQIGWPASSPSGRHVAVVEAISSDRWVVAGDLRLIETASGKNQRVRTGNMDVACVEWCSEHEILLAGHRGFETVIGIYNVKTELFSEHWRSDDVSFAGRYARVAKLESNGDCVGIGESFVRSPEIAVIRRGEYRVVRSLDVDFSEHAAAIHVVEKVRWFAPDGLEVNGWLLLPQGAGPYPLVVHAHGGPVWHWRPYWLGRGGLGFPMLMLLRSGYAVLFPNPRGSSGRGQEFVRPVVGDMGGADTHDFLSGVDFLVENGLADPKRIGITGASYGGFMTSWLITQDRRFSAAVSVAPVTNQVTEHLVSNIPHFVSMFLADTYTNLKGKYFERSPIMHAHKAETPTLNVCGALDRNTPPEEALQFHNALLENGVTSVLVNYPGEGHGIRNLPAVIDYTARLVSWFQRYMPATPVLEKPSEQA